MSEPIRVVVYTKPGCTLCGPMIHTAQKVCEELDLSVEEVDISRDPALTERYGAEIPVLAIDGQPVFKGHLAEAALKKRLKKERGQARAPAAPQIEALEDLEPPRWMPPKPIAAIFLAATVGLAGYFVAQGVVAAQGGQGRLAGQLLKIQPRSQQPVHFELESLAGKKVKLDDFKDKTVFLNFWATWCPPCVEEMPSMIRLQQRLAKDPRFVVLAVSADDSWEPVRKFFQGKVPEFEVLLDPQGKIAREYGTTMFPETYVVKNGKIVAFIEGPRDWDRWYADEFLRASL